MNLILFDQAEPTIRLERSDKRAGHLLKVLRRSIGEPFDVGVVNGPIGKGTIISITDTHLDVAMELGSKPPPPLPIELLIGLPRPQTARKILQEATSIGARALHFFGAEKGEPGYAQSTLWSTREWKDLLKAGAAQAFHTFIPEIRHYPTLSGFMNEHSCTAGGIALDLYEATHSLKQAVENTGRSAPLLLAFGPERGWSNAERDLLRARRFILAQMGQRVLRNETAVVAALALTAGTLGLL